MKYPQPWSEEAEIALLGACLLDHQVIEAAAEQISPDDFYDQRNRIIYQALLDLSNQGKPVDCVTVAERVKEEGALDQIGGVSRIAGLAMAEPTTAHAEHHAQIIREHSVKRQVFRICSETAKEAIDQTQEAEGVLDRATAKLMAVAEQHTIDRTSGMPEIVSRAFARLEHKKANQSKIHGLTSGFVDLDAALGGMKRQDLIIIAGRPSMGKSALGLQIAYQAARETQLPAFFGSLEMSEEQLGDRLLSLESRIDGWKLQQGMVSSWEWDPVVRATSRLVEVPFVIDESPAVNITHIRRQARKLKRKSGLSLVVVDYLQLMDGVGEKRVEVVSSVSRGLKALAKELDVPVVALSQLNRSCETRDNKRPLLADLRESGQIEQDADVILFIYRDEVYNPNTSAKGLAEILIRKNRNGPTGMVKLAWRAELTRFDNFEEHHGEQSPAGTREQDVPF